MSKKSAIAISTTAAGLAAVVLVSPATYAAEPAQSVQSAIEEVLVTARRREESLQDVPIAISAFGGENLEARGIERVENMNAVAPNLSVMGGVNSGESQASFRVRGVPGVSVYIDGVNQPAAGTGTTIDGVLTMGVVEVDRIEVLRGPQGTLFGSSALGGAVHYITRAPADTFGSRIRAAIGSYDRRDISAAVDLPLSDTFKTKFTASSQIRDGFMESRTGKSAYGDVNDELYRADFLWKPLDALSVRYNYETARQDRIGPARVVAEIEPTGLITLPGGRVVNNYPQGQIYANIGNQFNSLTTVSGYPGGVVGERENMVSWPGNGLILDTDRHAADINWDINDTFRVRSISGYKELYRYTQSELDGSSLTTILDRETAAKNYSFGQELQLLGSHEKVDWVLGAFYEKRNERARTNTRLLAEFTCDMWNATQRAQRGIGTAQMANCLNLRAQALGVNNANVTANSNMTAAEIASRAAFLATNPNGTFNTVGNGGLDMSQFSAAVAGNTDQMTLQEFKSEAVFGDITWRATDQLTVAAGLRYSEDTSPGVIRPTLLTFPGQFLTGEIENMLGFSSNLPAPAGATKFNALTKRLTLQYQWNPDLMTYVSYSDGYQPGGVTILSVIVPGLIPYLANVPDAQRDIPLVVNRDEQTIKNYEIGLRADWLGGALRTNVTAFFMDWQNVPVTQYVATRWWDTDGNGTADSNNVDITGDGVPDPFYFPNLFQTSVAKAEAKGIELEAIWRATDNLRFDLNLGYLKTEYTELGAAALGVTPAVSLGTPFAAAPEYTANVSGQYVFGFSGGSALTPRIDYTYTDDYTLAQGVDNQRIQKGFGLLNARLTYDSGANWTVALTGSNLTDEWYFNSGFYTRAERVNFVTVGRPMEWGLQFDFRFD